MADILIRDLDDDLVATIDARARRAGISRTEFIRRALARERDSLPTSSDHLQKFADRHRDLADPEVMRDAWS